MTLKFTKKKKCSHLIKIISVILALSCFSGIATDCSRDESKHYSYYEIVEDTLN